MCKKVLISSCLLGKNVKYNGKNNLIEQNYFIEKLKSSNLLIPVCPEVDGGLPIPRVPVEILKERALNKNGEDKTREFKKGAKIALENISQNDIKMAIMKSKSPSCGRDWIYDGSFTKTLIQGDGITIKFLKQQQIQIFTEEELDDAYKFWKALQVLNPLINSS